MGREECRSWSAPACSAAHMRQRLTALGDMPRGMRNDLLSVSEAAALIKNPRIHVPSLRTWLPTRAVNSRGNVPPPLSASAQLKLSLSSGTSEEERLRKRLAEVEEVNRRLRIDNASASAQLSLVGSANAQAIDRCSQLEEENRSLAAERDSIIHAKNEVQRELDSVNAESRLQQQLIDDFVVPSSSGRV